MIGKKRQIKAAEALTNFINCLEKSEDIVSKKYQT